MELYIIPVKSTQILPVSAISNSFRPKFKRNDVPDGVMNMGSSIGAEEPLMASPAAVAVV